MIDFIIKDTWLHALLMNVYSTSLNIIEKKRILWNRSFDQNKT